MVNEQTEITMVEKMIPTKISSHSLVGIHGTYPRGRGNYITVSGGNEHYAIVNIGAEDLQDAIRLNIIGDQMKAMVFQKEGSPAAAWIIDDRLPSKVLEPRHWYNGAGKYMTAMLRWFHNVPADVCLHNHPESNKDSFVSSRGYRTDSGWVHTGWCCECKEQMTRH